MTTAKNTIFSPPEAPKCVTVSINTIFSAPEAQKCERVSINSIFSVPEAPKCVTVSKKLNIHRLLGALAGRVPRVCEY